MKSACPLDPGNYGLLHNVKSPEQFGDWRKQALDFYRQAVHMPETIESAPLNPVTTETVKFGVDVTRHRIEYDSADGLRIPAYLFVPKTDRPVPAVIVYHGHGDGKINAAERAGTNENALAKYLAETLGYVVLAPDTRTFGEFEVRPQQSHADYFSGLLERKELFMAALMDDGCRDMALLRETPEVDTTRIGVAGVSMGSWRALNHAVLHEDIRAVAVASLFLPWDYFFSEKHCRCQHIPALAEKMGAEDLAATIFPRDIMIQWGLDDKYYEMGAEDLIKRTTEIADFLGYSSHLKVDRRPGMGHRFSNPEIAEFLRASLGEGAWK